VFIIFGFVIGAGGFNIAKVDVGHSAIHLIAEFTLILVLFIDASRIDLKSVRRDHNLPARMLIIGLPLTIVAGTIIAALLFPAFSFWEAALLAALLAPTDAALGQAVLSAEVVPVRIRQTINIESGLNDGIALPAVLLFAALASAKHGTSDAGEWFRFVAMQLTLGPLTGVVVGIAGARLLDSAAEHRWANTSFQGIGILSLAVLTYVVAELIGGNGFIAAFVGGMVFGNTVRHPCTFLFEFMETEGIRRCVVAAGHCARHSGVHCLRRAQPDSDTDDPDRTVTCWRRIAATDATLPRLVRPTGTCIDIVCATHSRQVRDGSSRGVTLHHDHYRSIERVSARRQCGAACEAVRSHGIAHGRVRGEQACCRDATA